MTATAQRDPGNQASVKNAAEGSWDPPALEEITSAVPAGGSGALTDAEALLQKNISAISTPSETDKSSNPAQEHTHKRHF